MYAMESAFARVAKKHTTAGTQHNNYTHAPQMCDDPLAQLYLPRGQYVDYVRVADYCTVTVKETNVFHRQASISARGLRATDCSTNDCAVSSYDRQKERGQEEEEGERINRRKIE